MPVCSRFNRTYNPLLHEVERIARLVATDDMLLEVTLPRRSRGRQHRTAGIQATSAAAEFTDHRSMAMDQVGDSESSVVTDTVWYGDNWKAV